MASLDQKSNFKSLGHLDVSLFVEVSGWQERPDWWCFLSDVFRIGLAISSLNSNVFDFSRNLSILLVPIGCGKWLWETDCWHIYVDLFRILNWYIDLPIGNLAKCIQDFLQVWIEEKQMMSFYYDTLFSLDIFISSCPTGNINSIELDTVKYMHRVIEHEFTWLPYHDKAYRGDIG